MKKQSPPSMFSGWIFDAETNDIGIVKSKFSYEDIVRILQSDIIHFVVFDTPEGAFRIWYNIDTRKQFFYNESAQNVLEKITHKWPSFHGNFLITYLGKPANLKSDLDLPLNMSIEDCKIPMNMPKISLTQFVDACNLSIEKRNA